MIKVDLKIDPSKCPLCGESNACGNLSKPGETKACWCQAPEVLFPEALIKQVPFDLRQKACICKNCALEVAFKV